MEITGKTGLYALIGNPVEHSLSPLMHNAAFRNLSLDSVYVALRVSRYDLEKAISGIRSLGILGFNVTIPYKTDILSFLDDVDKMAVEIGSINTVVCKKDKLIGYNTDGEGALKTLVEGGADPEGKKIVLLGAGGAAKSIAYYIAPLASSLIIMNRTKSKAVELCSSIKNLFSTSVKGKKLTTRNLHNELSNTEILINATSVGMYPNSDLTLVTRGLIRTEMTVFDIVYTPLETSLLCEAKRAGANTINGIKMLVYQGAKAFELWTNRKAPIDVMIKAITDKLARKKLWLASGKQ